jgi:hypothetical protein
MDVNVIANGDGGIFATACCKTGTIGTQPVSFFENFKHTRSFVPTYPDEAFVQEVLAQIVWHQNLDIFLPQPVAKLPSECELTSALPENLRSSLPSIEELEAELGRIHLEAQICVF